MDSDPSVPTLKENMLYGRGASDMKSGLAAMAWLLGEMKRQNKVPSCNIVFAATCDGRVRRTWSLRILT